MRSIVFCILALAAVQVRSKPSANAPDPKPLDDLLTKMEGLQNSLKKMLPNGRDVSKSVIFLSEDIARNVEKFTKTINSQEIIGNVERDITLQLANFVDQVSALMGGVITESAKKSFANIEQQANSICTEAQALQKSIQTSLEDAQQQMASLVMNFYKYISTAGNRLKAEVEAILQ
ncbi:uncharacterized protein LOC116160879 [Photinus pyralis]|nr:uncharacterized protein LOC116160879 [Photinus pyralis]